MNISMSQLCCGQLRYLVVRVQIKSNTIFKTLRDSHHSLNSHLKFLQKVDFTWIMKYKIV